MFKKFMVILLLFGISILSHSMETIEKETFSELPAELRTSIFEFMGLNQDIDEFIKSIVSLRSIKNWKRIIDSEEFWIVTFTSFFRNISSKSTFLILDEKSKIPTQINELGNLMNQISRSEEIIAKKIETKTGQPFQSEFLTKLKNALSTVIANIKQHLNLHGQILESIENLKYDQTKRLLDELKQKKPVKAIWDSLLPEIADKLSIPMRCNFKKIANSCPEVEEIVNKLISSGVSINAKDGWGKTALISFASFPQLSNLIGSGRQLMEESKKISNCLNTLVKILIQNGADVNAQSNVGETALIAASRNGHFDIVKTLIDTGKAHVNIKNRLNQTALNLARAKGAEIGNGNYAKIIELLKEKGAN